MNEKSVVSVSQVIISPNRLLISIFVLVAFLALVLIVGFMKIYKKAGKPAISAIVPIWNIIVWLEIIEKPIWYLFLLIIPGVNIVILLLMYIGLAKKFGKDTAFGVLTFFFSWIMIPLLAFSNYEIQNTEQNEEPIYNPFNETAENVSTENTNLETVNNVQPQIGQIPVMDNANLNQVDVNPESVNNNPETPEISIPEVNNSEGVLSQGGAGEINPISEAIDPMNQDAQDVQDLVNNLYKDKPQNAKNIAFSKNPKLIETPTSSENSTNSETIEALETLNDEPATETLSEPSSIDSLNSQVEPIEKMIIEPIQEEKIDTIDLEDNSEKELIKPEIEENENSLDNIELPERATKTCPACGVSLAEEQKFCIACGTQL